MKRFVLVALCVLVVMIWPAALASTNNAFFIEGLSLTMITKPDWIIVTNDTKPEDLVGMNFFGLTITDDLARSIVEMKADSQTTAEIIAWQDEEHIFSINIYALETEGTKELWDFSSINNFEASVNASGSQYSTYCTDTDQYLVFKQEDTEENTWVYFTLSNGKCVAFAFSPFDESTDKVIQLFAKRFLSGCSFSKQTNPNAKEPESRIVIFFKSLVQRLGTQVVSCIIFGGIIALFATITSLIRKAFGKKVNQKKESSNEL